MPYTSTQIDSYQIAIFPQTGTPAKINLYSAQSVFGVVFLRPEGEVLQKAYRDTQAGYFASCRPAPVCGVGRRRSPRSRTQRSSSAEKTSSSFTGARSRTTAESGTPRGAAPILSMTGAVPGGSARNGSRRSSCPSSAPSHGTRPGDTAQALVERASWSPCLFRPPPMPSLPLHRQ